MSALEHDTIFRDPETMRFVAEVSSVTIMKTAGPMLLAFIALEAIISLFRRSKTHRLNDTINSMSHGMLERVVARLTSKTLEFGVYCYIYAHWAPIHLEENLLTGVLAFLGVDLGYYWFHRMAHEINLFWATHSVHHSSEEYNLSTAMRQSSLQTYCSWMFYLPLALIVPPRLFYLHLQINLIYQFWIHTKVVDKMGVLEWVLNTPSHHRVHHGRNPRYLDRNYGGVLIVFDRLFGTFQAEDEEVAFGLVHPSQSFNLFEGQLAHFKWMWQRLGEEKGVWNKWAVIWKGPGWHSGTPRLGDPSEVPAIDPTHRKYNPTLPFGFQTYLAVNFFCNCAFSVFINLGLMTVPRTHIVFVLLFTASLQSFSMLCDNSPTGPYLELLRTGLSIIIDAICYATSEPGQYRFLWYTDRLPSANSLPLNSLTGEIAGPYYSPLNPAFVLFKAVVITSFFFMLGHILLQNGLIQRVKAKTKTTAQAAVASEDRAATSTQGTTTPSLPNEETSTQNIAELFEIPRPESPLANVKTHFVPSPSNSRSRKPRGLQVGVAL
jgi:alkylglycerol monooxygenase